MLSARNNGDCSYQASSAPPEGAILSVSKNNTAVSFSVSKNYTVVGFSVSKKSNALDFSASKKSMAIDFSEKQSSSNVGERAQAAEEGDLGGLPSLLRARS